jgi:hypothetical protein
MSKISKNGVGIVVFLLSYIGINVGEDTILEFISAVGTIVSFALLLWNQLGRADVAKFFFKR